MFTSSFKSLLIGGRLAATAALLATSAVAQTTSIDTPQGNTVVVPDQALEEQSGASFVAESDYPRLESMENNQIIADSLIAQGYSDVFISREGPILTVTAQRDSMPIELVYSTANGRLISVDGVETRAPAKGASAGDTVSGTTAELSTTDSGVSDEAADDGVTDGSQTGAATNGTSAGSTEGGEEADTGTEAGTGDADADGADAGGPEAADADGADSDGADGDGEAGGSDSNG
nr:hypothetical protein [Paracoccus saliphilus]